MASGQIQKWPGVLFFVLVTCAFLAAAGVAFAVSGLSIDAPGDLHVNATTGYSASATAGILETVTQAEFTFPANTDVSGATVTLSSGTPTVSIDNVNHRVTVTTNAFYLLGGTFTATVNNVVNPSAPGTYTYTVSITGSSTANGTSAGYTLISNTSAPSVGPISLADSTESVTTTTTVPIHVGAAGRLASDAAPGGVTTPNTIVVTFPVGYTMPSNPATTSVTVDGIALSAAPIVLGQQVTLKVPSGVSVSGNATATVEFLPAFGMANPASGTYAIQAHTDAETGMGTSANYTVGATPTTLTVVSANAPAAQVAKQGDTRVVDGLRLQRNASSNSVSVSAIALTDTGTAPATTISGASVYRDDGNNSYGAGDTLLNSTAATFSGSTASVTFDSAESVGTSAQQYWVVYTVGGSAADGSQASSLVSSVTHTADSLANTAATGATMTVDAAAPTVAITSPAADNTALFGSIPPATIAGVAADTVSGVTGVTVAIQRASDSQWFNGIGWQVGATTVAASSSDGWATWSYSWDFTPAVQDHAETYTITAEATDGVGFTGQGTRTGIGIDNVAPYLVSATAVDPTHVDVTFSDALATATVEPADFTITGLSTSGAALQPGGTVVRLLTATQSPGSAYTLDVTLGSVTDVAGNPNVAPTSTGFTGAGAVVRVASTAQPPASFATTGAVLPADGFTLEKTAGPSSASVSAVSVEDTGTATATDVTGVSIYRDTNSNGVFDTGTDALLNAVPAPFSGSGTVVALDAIEPVGSATQYFVVYHFAVGATDGHVATSKVTSITTDASVVDLQTVRGNELTIDTAPPPAPNMTASATSSTTIDASWNAVTDATSGLSYYALHRADGSLIATTTETSMTVGSLSPATEYGFYVEAFDLVGNFSRSATVNATTYDGVPPVTTINFPAADGNAGWWRTPPGVTASTNEPATSYYNFTSAVGPWFAWTGTVTPPQGSSTLFYYSQDLGGNIEPLSTHAFQVDSVGPTTPSATASADSSTAVTLSWVSSTDLTSGFDHYAVRYANGSLIGTTTATSAPITGLTPATTYGFYVEALDIAGNVTRGNTAYVHMPSDQLSTSGAIPPHVSQGSDTDVCAMCHVSHTSANEVGPSVDSTRNVLIVGIGTRTIGDVQLCFACHGVDTLGSTRDVQSEVNSGPGHLLTPETSAFGPNHKQCSDCHDVHGSAKTAAGAPYPALLRSRDASGTLFETGEEYCGACHTIRTNNEFPGLAVWNLTAHSTIPTPTSGTDIVCSVCHAPHGSPAVPSIRTQLTPPAVAETVTVTANDRTFCEACHAAPVRSWDGTPTFAASAHGTSDATIAAGGEWASRDATLSARISRPVGECQNCHAAMGASNGSGGVIPRLLNASGQALCLECHRAAGPAKTDFTSLTHSPATGAASLAVAYGATADTVEYGRVHVYSRVSTTSATLVGPREYVDSGHVGATAAGDIDAVNGAEVLTAKPGSSAVWVLSNSAFSGLSQRSVSLLQPASFLAIGEVMSDVVGVPEIVTANSSTVRVYRWNGTSLDAITAFPVDGQITGLAVGKVLAGSLAEVVVTTRQASPPDKLLVLEASGSSLTTAGAYPTRTLPVGPSIGDLDGDGIGEIAVGNAGETNPVLSVFSGTGSELMTAGSATDTSATATLIDNVLPGLTQGGTSGAEVTLALAKPDGPARVEVFPQSSSGLGSPLTQAFGTQTNPESLAAGELDNDGRKELVVGLSGYFSRNAALATPPGVAIVHSSSDGQTLGTVNAFLGGGVERAGGTRVAVANLGDIGESRHPIEAAEGSHVSSEVEPVPEHVACDDCHNSHAATATTGTAPALPGVLTGSAGVSIRNLSATLLQLTQVDSVSQEYEVCLKCHSTWASGGMTSIASLVNTRTASFHPVEGVGRANNAVGDTFTSGWGSSSLIYCTDCHGNATPSEPGGPHRSKDAPLLVAPATGIAANDADGLCFKCHRYDLYATGAVDGSPSLSSGFVDPDLAADRRKLHAFHTQSGFACSACHVSHGSVDLRYLLRDTLNWDPNVSGGGACASACHTGGARHEYTR